MLTKQISGHICRYFQIHSWFSGNTQIYFSIVPVVLEINAIQEAYPMKNGWPG